MLHKKQSADKHSEEKHIAKKRLAEKHTTKKQLLRQNKHKVRSSYSPLAFFSIFSFLAKMLSFLLRDDNIFIEKFASGP